MRHSVFTSFVLTLAFSARANSLPHRGSLLQEESGVALSAAAGQKAQCTVTTGQEYVGNDVAPPIKGKTVDGCCEACADDSKCSYFTFVSEGGVCMRKGFDAPDTYKLNASCVSGSVGTYPPAPNPPAEVAVVVDTGIISVTEDAFLCWNLDASVNRQFFTRNLSVAAPFGRRLARLASALGESQDAGYSMLRFGGTGNDYLTYEVAGTPCPPPSETKQCMNMTMWENLLGFARAANSRMIVGLSLNTGHDFWAATAASDDPFPQMWDPTNSKHLLEWTIAHGWSEVILGLELGNEQNTKYSGRTAATNMAALYNLTLQLWEDADEKERPLLVGPDPHSFKEKGVDKTLLDYLATYADAVRELNVPLHAVTVHEYAEIDNQSFTSPKKLDVTASVAAAVNDTVTRHMPHGVQAWGGEVGPHNGGSVACDHTNMRWSNFADSLWYADALATHAKHGFGAFCRQDMIGIDYGLLDCSTGEPLPDFWLGLLWTKFMGPRVLSASVKTSDATAVRAYAHCAPRSLAPEHGGTRGRQGGGGATLSVLLINLGRSQTDVTLDVRSHGINDADESQQQVRRVEYHLTSVNHGSALSNATGLLGTNAALNGRVLEAGADGSVPDVVSWGEEAETSSSAIVLGATSIAFVVYYSDTGFENCASSP